MAIDEIEALFKRDDPEELRAFFAFDHTDDDEVILVKYDLWARRLFPKYFESDDAPFHHDINLGNIDAYTGLLDYFVDIAFRGAGKDVKTKLFIPFAIVNDMDHSRKYYKVLSEDLTNSRQSVTDIYNVLVSPQTRRLYPDTFAKSVFKREETMSSFTTASGIKVLSDTVGTEQRGALQEEARPDFIWFNDFENRKTLRSAVITKSIADNMEEARTSLQKGGCCIYTCNYLSERGTVHQLVTKKLSARKRVLIVPIIKDGKPTWNRYSLSEIEKMREDDDDFAGERLCEPSAGHDIFFDRTVLDLQRKKQPLRVVADFKIFHTFDPSHRYGAGFDVAGGVGLDSSTSIFIDFATLPNKVAATFKSDSIKPDVFGYEIIRQADMFGRPIVAPENNKFDMCIGVLRHQGYDNIYFTEQKETRVGMPPRVRQYGWNTNTMTKPKMLFDFKKAVEDGHLELSDPDLIAELRSYTRDDLMDKDEDVRLTTRHFDLLMAAAIAYQMKDWAEVKKDTTSYQQPAYERPTLE